MALSSHQLDKYQLSNDQPGARLESPLEDVKPENAKHAKSANPAIKDVS